MSEADDVQPGEIVRWLQRIEDGLKDMAKKLEDLPADRQRLGAVEKRVDSLINRVWMVVFALAGLGVSVAALFMKGS